MVKLLKNATPTVVVVVGNMQQKQNLVILENIERVFQYFFVGVPYSWETGLLFRYATESCASPKRKFMMQAKNMNSDT